MTPEQRTEVRFSAEGEFEQMATVRVTPATPEQWPQLGRVFGPREKDPTSCWCQRFLRREEIDNRSALRREVQEAEIPIGLLAYLEDDVIGWTRVMPRSALPGITENRALAKILDEDPDAWWVSCFVVRREHRGIGIGAALLDAAVDWAVQHGASELAGHPVDTNGLAGTPSPSATFTGTLTMFQQAGFTEIGRTYPTRPVMRLKLLHR
jgi:GNAT superfamily N-acetyltransferase